MIARGSHLLATMPKPLAKSSTGSVIRTAFHRPLGELHRHKGPWDPTDYELWVENGVVWDLMRSWILGFIDYPSIGPYFAQTPLNPTPQMLAGGPFSMNDFPVYGFQLLVDGQVRPGSYYIFSALSMLAYIPNVWQYFSNWGLTRHWTSPPAGAGPLVSAAHLRSFIAGTPSGRKTLSASYVMYVPPEQYWPTTYHTWPP
jgi:hypothetical protein